jgi:hypothetical protein
LIKQQYINLAVLVFSFALCAIIQGVLGGAVLLAAFAFCGWIYQIDATSAQSQFDDKQEIQEQIDRLKNQIQEILLKRSAR